MLASGPGVWLRRLVGRNPLVRGTDRVEAVVRALIVALAVLAVPVAAATGTAVHDDLVHTFAAQRLERQRVEATVVGVSAARVQPYEVPDVAEIAWEFRGSEHTAEIPVYDSAVGDRVPVWVDEAGNRTGAVPTDSDAVAQAILAALVQWLLVVGIACGAGLALRLRLDALRAAAWDRELDDLASNST